MDGFKTLIRWFSYFGIISYLIVTVVSRWIYIPYLSYFSQMDPSILMLPLVIPLVAFGMINVWAGGDGFE